MSIFLPIFVVILFILIFSKGCDVLSISTSDMISDHFSVIADFNIPTDHIRNCAASYHILKVEAT